MISLEDAVGDLYRIAVVEGKATSTARMQTFSGSQRFDDFFDTLVRQVVHRNPNAIR